MLSSRSIVLRFSLIGLSAATIISLGCKSGGDGGGGDQGGSDSGGNAGGDGGKTSTGGKGGSTSGGQAGGTAGGQAGSSSGGAAGGAPAGGGGVAGGAAGVAGDPEKQIFTEPTCIYRPDHPDQHQCGPAGTPVYASMALKNTGFCGDMYNQDGVFTVGQSKLDATAWNQAASGTTMTIPNVGRVYLPGGKAKYDSAEVKTGEVALTFWTSLFANSGQDSDTYHIENIHEYLVAQGQMPYTIAVFLNDDLGPVDRIKAMKATVLPALKAAFPKISDNPAYRSIAGQSTAGTNSFDTIWMGTDIISKGIGGSPSLVCFGCNGGLGPCPTVDQNCVPENDWYSKEIAFCPARNIRWTATVGTCDIYGTLSDRILAGCGNGADDGSVDGSKCHASWLPTNKDVTNAMKTKGLPYQLFVITGGGHTPTTWAGVALAYQLRWIFKDITCKM